MAFNPYENKKEYRDRLARISNPVRPATIGQRTALFNMYSALKWDVKGIRNIGFFEASDAIAKAKEYIKNNGFPKNENGNLEKNDDF